MMVRHAVKWLVLGAVLPSLAVASARADWRAPILGAPPVLPPHFVPMRFAVGSPRLTAAALRRQSEADGAWRAARPARYTPPPAAWRFPMLERRLSPAERDEPLAPELADALSRIEPMYDPTRLDGTGAAPPMAVATGTAMMDNVFADRWRRADPDPTVDVRLRPTALAWQDAGPRPCEAYSKNRIHGWNAPSLTAMTPQDCRRLAGYRSSFDGDEPLVPLVTAWIGVPVFAAPLPGSRMSSEAFWAARRAQIAEIQARLRRKWVAGGMPGPAETPLLRAAR